MDFGDLPRGGTAPVSTKPSKSGVTGNVSTNVRPKTRAVDSDIHDTNIDLKLNRYKGVTGANGGGFMNEFMDEALGPSNDWNADTNTSSGNGYRYSQPAPPSSSRGGGGGGTGIGTETTTAPSSSSSSGQPRAPSRNRVSKDPKRQQNNLISGLSAYTQNIPNMILHPSKKPHRTTSSTSPRPTTSTKEHKNMNTLNEIRNAYGADFLPFGKPGSPARSKISSAGSANSGNGGSNATSGGNTGNISSNYQSISPSVAVSPSIIPNEIYANGKGESADSMDDNNSTNQSQRTANSANAPNTTITRPRKSSRSSSNVDSATSSPVDPELLARGGVNTAKSSKAGNSGASSVAQSPMMNNTSTDRGTDSGSNSPSMSSIARKGASSKKSSALGGLLKSSLTGNKPHLSIIPPSSSANSSPSTITPSPAADQNISQPVVFTTGGTGIHLSPSPLMMAEMSQQNSATTISSINPLYPNQSSPELMSSSPMNNDMEIDHIQSHRTEINTKNTELGQGKGLPNSYGDNKTRSAIDKRVEDEEDVVDATNQYHSDFEEHVDTVEDSSDSGIVQTKKEQEAANALAAKQLAKKTLLAGDDVDDIDFDDSRQRARPHEVPNRSNFDDDVQGKKVYGTSKVSTTNSSNNKSVNIGGGHIVSDYATMASRPLRDEGYREQEDKLEYYLDGIDNNDFDFSINVNNGTSGNIYNAANGVQATTTLKSISTAMETAESGTSTNASVATMNSAGSVSSTTSGPTRPQSRKLYLGSEKNQRQSTSPSTSPIVATAKAPRSAGARYVASSPAKNNEDDNSGTDYHTDGKPNLRRLSSYNDLQRSHPWSADDHLPVRRPPSRQSSAFPVHLADDSNKTAGSTAPTSSVTSATTSPSISKRWQQQQQEQDVSLNLVNDLDQDDPELMIPTSASSSVPSTAQAGSLKPTPPIQPNTEPRMIKKSKPLSSGPTAALVDNDDAASVHSSGTFDNRPPSRQKVAAQHLFDNEGKHSDLAPVVVVNSSNGSASGRRSATERRQPTSDAMTPSNVAGSGYEWESGASSSSGKISTVRKLSSSNSGTYIPSTAVGGSRNTTAGIRGTTTRSGMVYDPRDDGFLELGPDDSHVPFSISVNYGDESNGPNTSSNRSNLLRSNQVVDEITSLNEQFSDFSLIGGNGMMTSTSVNASIKSAGSKHQKGSNNGNAVGKEDMGASDYSYGMLSPVRPKSVNNAILSSTTSPTVAPLSKGSNVGRSIAKGATKPSSAYYNDNSAISPIQLETETLRSKSANNYLSHARERMSHENDVERMHTTPLPPTKPSNRSSRPKNAASVGSAWGVEQDPRSIPRAQNTYGLGADSGWTSPSMLVAPQPFLSSSPNNMLDNYLIQDDDDMTILTEDSGQNMDHSMSLQSFPLESSLGEDFLSLFAPAGR